MRERFYIECDIKKMLRFEIGCSVDDDLVLSFYTLEVHLIQSDNRIFFSLSSSSV